ncbi:MAG TPA: HEAT repeat domain-containing protein [Candidatus Krumholzibacterium sp.]|nr:HEAT repeat domain-containing protein [Candidatus Krumholzibacterium sp.]
MNEEERELRRMLSESGHEGAELEEMVALYMEMGDIEVPGPGQELSDRFYSMLEEEKLAAAATGPDPAARPAEDRRPSLLSWLFAPRPAVMLARVAFAAVFIAAGWLAAGMREPGETASAADYAERLEYVTSEMTEMKKMMMFSMLSRDSAAERLQAVQYLKDMAEGDEQVLTALLGVFERDPNVNVRLASLDALASAAGDERVAEVLLRNIESQESPLMQLALVDAMVSRSEPRALGHFVHLLERDDLRPVVRRRINEVVRFLS